MAENEHAENAIVKRIPEDKSDSGSKNKKQNEPSELDKVNAESEGDSASLDDSDDKWQGDDEPSGKSDKKDGDNKGPGDAGMQHKDALADTLYENGKGDKKDDGKEKKESLKEKAMKIAAANAAAKGAHTVSLVTRFIMMLKMMLEMLQMLGAAIVQAAVTAFHTILAAAMQVAAHVAAFLGISTIAAAIGVGGAVILSAVIVVSGITTAIRADQLTRVDDLPPDCAEQVQEIKDGLNDPANISGITEENAKKVYSFFSTYGASDVHIAGILGNWTCESGIDPTSIEGIYDERHNPSGPKKVKAFADLNAYTTGTLFPFYASRGVSINKNAFKASDGKYYCGLGLGQWTGPRAYSLLSFANGISMEWYLLDTQLAFMISSHDAKSWLDNWFQSSVPNAETAAEEFMHGWEGISNGTTGNRKSSAARYMVSMAEWEVDSDWANSLIELAGSASLGAADNSLKNALDDCQKERKHYGNESIAEAAVSYAFLHMEDSHYNNGTLLYQKVFQSIWGADQYKASCCRGVSTAVRWSGADDTFPVGGPPVQLAYVRNSEKWEKVNWSSLDDLEPGDILFNIRPSDGDVNHISVFTGNEIIQEIHGTSDTSLNFVEANYGGYSPHCRAYPPHYYDGVRFRMEAYRCVSPDNSDTYENAADGLEGFTGSPFNPSAYP